jgi:hypothetical protein
VESESAINEIKESETFEVELSRQGKAAQEELKKMEST